MSNVFYPNWEIWLFIQFFPIGSYRNQFPVCHWTHHQQPGYLWLKAAKPDDRHRPSVVRLQIRRREMCESVLCVVAGALRLFTVSHGTDLLHGLKRQHRQRRGSEGSGWAVFLSQTFHNLVKKGWMCLVWVGRSRKMCSDRWESGLLIGL